MQNERLRELLDLQAKREDFVFESARVTGRSTDNWASTLTISKGTSAGVEAGDCVVTSTGRAGGSCVQGGAELVHRLHNYQHRH